MNVLAVVDRILARCIEDERGCWVWQGYCDGKGYGYVWATGKHLRVHRVVYRALIAEFPEGLQSDHLCRNTSCCNPWHIEPVTNQVNSQRRSRHGAPRGTECARGHTFTPATTITRANGSRTCRTCNQMRDRKAWQETR